MSIIEQVLSTIAPHECSVCGREGTLICNNCVNRLAQAPSECYCCGCITDETRICSSCRRSSDLSNVWTVAAYDGIAKEIIHKLKFERASAAADDMARLIAAVLPPARWTVTYVPTANVRVRQRGYDQAQRIAKCLARITGCVFVPLLARQGSQRQVGKGRTARREQMLAAFYVYKKYLEKNEQILLIDDVITTGATLDSAAAALKSAGAKSISAAVFAVAGHRL